MKKLLVVAVLLICVLPAHADRVIGIADGDTLTVLHNKRPLKIRLANIDAPEKKQAFGQASKQSLAEMCFGQDATYKTQTIDKYGRTVARVMCDGIDANRAQVERGLAWVYVRYNKDGSLLYFQSIAKNQRRGVWVEANPTPPCSATRS